MRIPFLILISIIILNISAFAIAGDGSEGGNGGQLVAAAFSRAALNGVGVLEEYFFVHGGWCEGDGSGEFRRVAPLCELKKIDLRRIIANTKVVAVPRILEQDLLSGDMIEFAAKNYPEKNLIKVSIASWKDTPCTLDKIGLAFHEYLGIAGLERDSYQYSSLLREWLEPHGEPKLHLGCY